METFEKDPKQDGTFRIDSFVAGPVETNVYLVTNTETGEVLIVDPGDEAETIGRFIRSENRTPRAILLTHGHLDHFMAAGKLRKAFGIPVLCHETEKALLEDYDLNCSRAMGLPAVLKPDDVLRDGEEKTLAGLTFRVIHTPGHTAGSCCFFFPEHKTLLSGDTLFCMSFGRTDLPTGNMRELIRSLQMLLKLPEDVTVYPGHGDVTTIAFEKQMNPVAMYI